MSSPVLKVQQNLLTWATSSTERAFDDIYNFIFSVIELLYQATNEVLAKGSSRVAGVDGVTRDRVLRDMPSFVEDLRRCVRVRSFRWSPTRSVEVPKPAGGVRPLQIPVLRDRIVQRAIGLLLHPIFDCGFGAESHGFRPGRGLHTALEHMVRLVADHRADTLLELDIKNFFGGLRHTDVLTAFTERVTDKRLVRLIRRLLVVSPVGEKKAVCGVPQGGPLSPLLSNIAFCRADDYFRSLPGVVGFSRYADDVVVAVAGGYNAASRTRQAIEIFLKEQYNLEISASKTFIRSAEEGCSCLGHDIKRMTDGEVLLSPSPSRVARLKQKLVAIRDGVGNYNRLSVEKKNSTARTVVSGWAGSYRPRELTREIGAEAFEMIIGSPYKVAV